MKRRPRSFCTKDHTQILTREYPDPESPSEPTDGIVTPGTDLGDAETVEVSGPPLEDASGRLTKLQRHWLTGELRRVPCESLSGRVTLVAGDAESVRILPRRDYEKVHLGLSILPEKATPARIAEENRQARLHGTGAVFDSKGRCHISSRGCQNKELKRQNQMNPDAGYGDFCGR